MRELEGACRPRDGRRQRHRPRYRDRARRRGHARRGRRHRAGSRRGRRGGAGSRGQAPRPWTSATPHPSRRSQSAATSVTAAWDVLCNNAGVLGITALGAESLDNWRWIIDVNLLGVAYAINAFVPRMLARVGESGGEAHVVNTASMAGLRAGDGWDLSAYGALEVRGGEHEPQSARRAGRQRDRRPPCSAPGASTPESGRPGATGRPTTAVPRSSSRRSGCSHTARSTRWPSAATCCARSSRTSST